MLQVEYPLKTLALLSDRTVKAYAFEKRDMKPY